MKLILSRLGVFFLFSVVLFHIGYLITLMPEGFQAILLGSASISLIITGIYGLYEKNLNG